MPLSKDKEMDSGVNNYSVNFASSDSPKLSSKSASELDDNYDIYQRHAGEQVDPAEAKKVLRKIDLRIL